MGFISGERQPPQPRQGASKETQFVVRARPFSDARAIAALRWFSFPVISPQFHMLGEPLISRLRALRRRMLAQALVESFARALIVLSLIALGLSVAERWQGTNIPWRLMVPGSIAISLAWAALRTGMRSPTLGEIGALLDRLGATRDRWTTVLAFQNPGHDAVRRAAGMECEKYLAGRDFRPFLPWRVPLALVWSIAPLASIALLQWQVVELRAGIAHEQALAREEVSPHVARLATLAGALEKAREKHGEADLERIARELKRSAEMLRSDAKDRTAATKAAMRELSRLEQLVRETQQDTAKLSPDDLEALAVGLEQQEETAAAAEAIREGRNDDAARMLQKAAERLENVNDPVTAAQAEETLRKAMERLAQQRQISEALREIAREMSQRTGQGSTGTMLQKLAQMLQKARPASGGAQQPGQAGNDSKGTKPMLQKLLAALQNMKNGQPPGEPRDGGTEGDNPGGQVLVQSFGDPAGDAMPGPIAPAGNPGSERDASTTETPFGPERSEMADNGGELRLRGQLGEGESLSQLLPAAGGDDKARLRYKEIYDAMAPAAEDAMLQDSIPIGSRFFIKRYFESIRPAE
jgi:hypothetical protein